MLCREASGALRPGSQLPTRTGEASLAYLVLKKKKGGHHLDPDWAPNLLTKQLLSHALGKFLGNGAQAHRTMVSRIHFFLTS